MSARQNEEATTAAWALGQLTFAMMGPALALDEHPRDSRSEAAWTLASGDACTLANRLRLDFNPLPILRSKGSAAKWSALGCLLEALVTQAERLHGRPIGDLVRLGNIAASLAAYGGTSHESSPIRLGLHSVSDRLGIRDDVKKEFLLDPTENSLIFAAVAIQSASALLKQSRAKRVARKLTEGIPYVGNAVAELFFGCEE